MFIIDGTQIAETVKKCFGLDVKLVSLNDDDYRHYYDGKRYHFDGADGEAVYYARVTEAHQDASSHVRMSGEIYNADDETDKLGKFEALAKPHQYGGKDTRAILSLKTDYYQ